MSNLHVCHLQDDTNWSLISSWLNQLEEIEDHVDAVRKKVKETATANKGLSTGERATYFQSLKVRLKRGWKDTKKIPPLPQTFSGGSRPHLEVQREEDSLAEMKKKEWGVVAFMTVVG